MSVATEAAGLEQSRAGVLTRAVERARGPVLALWAGLALLYLFIPIFVVIVFSFNDNQGRFNLTWQGFTTRHWADPFSVPGLGEAMATSLQIAAVSTVLAVALGTFMGLALVRHRFRGRAAADLFVFLPLATPEVVLGAALLSLFLTLNLQLGIVTLIIAHTMFNIAFVVVTIRARLEGMDTHLEEAAQDLGANGFTTFRKVTLPLIAPGVAAAALLSFAISVDDFVISNFNAGSTVTFPIFIWGAARQGVPAEVNVLATVLLLVAVLLMFVNLAVQRRSARRSEAAMKQA